MTPSDNGQEHAIPDCGEDFSDVEQTGMAIVFFTKAEYFDAIDLLCWLDEQLHDNVPTTPEGIKRKEQFDALNKRLRKRFQKGASDYIDEASYGTG